MGLTHGGAVNVLRVERVDPQPFVAYDQFKFLPAKRSHTDAIKLIKRKRNKK